MSRGARVGLLVGAIVILVVAFIALRPSAEDEIEPGSGREVQARLEALDEIA